MINLNHDQHMLIKIISEIYSKNAISENDMNSFFDEIYDAESSEDLNSIIRKIPLNAVDTKTAITTTLIPLEKQIIRGKSQRVIQTGEWLASRTIMIEAQNTSLKLDFSSYQDISSMEISIELFLKSCICKLLVPKSFAVFNKIYYSASSSIAKFENPGDPLCRIILSGSIKSSRIKIKSLR